MIGQYNEAIIWADKALQVNPKHCNSLHTKAESLRMLGQYNEAIFWADKAFQFDPKNCDSLSTKSVSLRELKKYNEAMKVIDQSLLIDPNHFHSLLSKGQILLIIGNCVKQKQKIDDLIQLYGLQIEKLNVQKHLFLQILTECLKKKPLIKMRLNYKYRYKYTIIILIFFS
ncbi:unnamed protein product [Paramecium sonneborni]|uniref:Tetratricopeptide repeat protein n=1 Tax=Paramecium sonneborni TaxID=65129 RepID=A0A8S1PZ42_9CILI|nr:unnamed protein product [Paramecium sonneborni]